MRRPIGPVVNLTRRAAVLLLSVALVVLSACQSTNVPSRVQATPPPASVAEPAIPEPPRVPRVAILLPLTGRYSELGTSMLQAAEMAFFDVAGQDFVLLPRDTAGTPDGAARAAQEAVADGAALILGPLFARSVSSVAPIAHQAGLNVISFSTNPAVAGNGIFVMGFLSRDQVNRIIQYSLANGLFRFAALVPNSAYGRQVAGEFQEGVYGQGAILVGLEYYDPSLPDNSEVVSRFAENVRDSIDAVMLPAGGQELLTIAPLLPYFDIDPAVVRFLGTGQWDTPGLGREPALIGGWYAAPDPNARAQFEARYQAVYGAAPERLATLAYDATALAAVLAKRPGGPDFRVEALTVPDGFTGLDGLFRFSPDGLVERRLAVLQVTRDAPLVINPAPTSFVTLTE